MEYYEFKKLFIILSDKFAIYWLDRLWWLFTNKLNKVTCRFKYFSMNGRKKMTNVCNKSDKTSWAIGGSLLSGIGIGFFFLQQSALYFVGSLISGLGAGLIVAAILSKIR